ncbi:hypothetical protein D9756_007285 [Leucocoprinus leucothites]|uniref:RNA-directed DNA polymerase n=1 Tax=Leucocoprinus leucothites TaxID=201217 RepID=A0A8H5D705_9AGAR|nr:hypothetical protein D9756_007285 [Leucoagaricus leucothites]
MGDPPPPYTPEDHLFNGHPFVGRFWHKEVPDLQYVDNGWDSEESDSDFSDDESVTRPLVIAVKINGYPTRALLGSGSLGDFMSSNLTQQFVVKKIELATPVNVQMAEIREDRYFDIINLSNYDLILGMPFLFQHQVSVSSDPPAVVVGSVHSKPMMGERVTKLSSQHLSVYEKNIDEVCKMLTNYAQKICGKGDGYTTSPLRKITHEIPLIVPHKPYSWRASNCPDKLLNGKNAYIKSGHWELRPARNAVPILLIPKPGRPDKPPKLWTVIDPRERNQNTRKLSSPLPDIDGMLRRFANVRYQSMIDLSDAYEQIRIRPEHVEWTAINTPSGTMMIIARIFESYLGKDLDNLLDDLLMGASTLQRHVDTCITAKNLSEGNHFWVNPKLHFLEREFNVLGCVVNDDGIKIDPHKVDALARWKTPMNRDLLRGFLSSTGYLADDIDHVRIPMGILHELTGTGVISQGEEWKEGRVAAFFSAKLKPAQQNYPVHEIELLAGYETTLRRRNILYGTHFRWYTDHKGLIHLLKQQNLSGRQARWLEKMGEFSFEVIYVPGTENILSDALSCLYSNDGPGTMRALSEYTYHDIVDVECVPRSLITMPLLVGLEGEAELLALMCSQVRGTYTDNLIPRGERMEGVGTEESDSKDIASCAIHKEDTDKKENKRLTIRIPARTRGGKSSSRLKIRLPATRQRTEDNDINTEENQSCADVTRTINDNNRLTDLETNNDTQADTMPPTRQ